MSNASERNPRSNPAQEIRGESTRRSLADLEADFSIPGQDDVEILRWVVEGTAHATGTEFFQSLVKNLAQCLGVGFAFVAQFASPDKRTRVRTIALWADGKIADNLEWNLPGTPCEDVVAGNLCHYPNGVQTQFPQDQALTDLGIESYLGVPLLDHQGKIIGHLAVFDREPIKNSSRAMLYFRIFAARASSELDRLQMELALRENETRLRDLYDEAPIAYVQEDLESRFISANRAAMRILGITAEDVPNLVGMSLVPDTPEAQRRVQEAFAAVGRGADSAGVLLELRRKDNGKPIWIQWWSRPDPGGKFTRTMFIDVTDRVVAEQEKARLAAQNTYLREEIKSVHNFEEIVGHSSSLRQALEQVQRVARTDASVLITGETGTGKELFARAIHSASKRHEKPLIKVNCAALPSGLIESELFGHEKGAFSGALQRRIGRFELAQGGTIFLDEIGEVPLDVQVKLLRVLQEREFERVGGSESIKLDVRIISATNRDLPKAIRDGKFREDLYYRLNVFPIELPPLRARAGDVAGLSEFFVARFSARVGIRIESISEATINRLCQYTWPGNIRELENVLERAIILSNGPILEIGPEVLGHASPPLQQTATKSDGGGRGSEIGTLEDNERRHILAALEQTKWVIDGPRGAAKVLDVNANTLRSRMKKLGITRASQPGV